MNPVADINTTKVSLFSKPQFDYKEVTASPVGTGALIPQQIILSLTPTFFHRRIYMHCSKFWNATLFFSLGGMNIFNIDWSSHTFPTLPIPPNPVNGEQRFSFLDALHHSKNEIIYSHPSQAGTHLQPFYLVGQWNQLTIQTIQHDGTPQDFYVGVMSQTQF